MNPLRPLQKLHVYSRAAMFTLFAPLMLLALALRTAVAFEHDPAGLLAWIDVYKSVVFANVGALLLTVAVLELVTAGPRRIVLLGAQLTALLYAVLSLVAFNFFLVTGSVLDAAVVAHALANAANVWDVVSSEAPTWVFLLAGLFTALIGAAPWVAQRRLSEGEGLSTRTALRIGGLGLVFGLAALLPTMAETNRALARDPAVQVASSWLDAALYDRSYVGNVERYTAAVKLERAAERAAARNVVFIILESTRAASTTLHEPEIQTTPYLATLRDTSLVAESAYAVVPHTSKALVAILCGIEPFLQMPILESNPGGIPGRCLPELLGEHGYATHFFQTANDEFENRPGLVENMGFDGLFALRDVTGSDWAKVNYFGVEDLAMLGPSEQWLDSIGESPFMLTYLTLTPHHNYLAPKRYGRHAYAEDDELNRYLNSVHYVDQFVREVVEMFKRKDLYDDTLFVILGDHGEAFGEHGRTQHDNVPYQEGLHIPLLFHAGPNAAPRTGTVAPAVSQLDVAPTVAHWLGYQVTNGEFPGVDVRNLRHERTLPAHCYYERRCVAAVERDTKYIHHFGQQPDELFDLAADPGETRNLAETRVADMEEKRDQLLAWRAGINGFYENFHAERIASEVSTNAPTPALDAEVDLGPITIVGYDLKPFPAQPGSYLTVQLYFRVDSEMPEGARLRVRGTAPNGSEVKLDHVPVNGLHPLANWAPGTYVRDSFALRLPAGDEGGTYPLEIWLDDVAGSAERRTLELQLAPSP